MKLLSLIIAATVSLSALAQSSPSEEYVATKIPTILKQIQEKYNDPEEPSNAAVAALVREAFLKDNYAIGQDEAAVCIAAEQREKDDVYASSYMVLKDGLANKCLAKNLTAVRK